MAPRPRPTSHESLLADNSQSFQCLLQSSPRRMSALGLDAADSTTTSSCSSWDDEHDIELTQQSPPHDPLWASVEDTACSNDGEIAKLMAVQWTKEERKQAQKLHKTLERRQRIGCFVLLGLTVISAIGFGVYKIIHNKPTKQVYQCPATIQDWEFQITHNSTDSVCRLGLEDCNCHDPNLAPNEMAELTDGMKEDTAMLTNQQQANDELLDVLFMGYFEGMEWNDQTYSIRPAHIARQQDVRVASMLYRLIQTDIIPETIRPRVWWISLGKEDLSVDGCHAQTVQSGVYQMILNILYRDDNAKIVLSPPSSLHDNKDWNDRLSCLASYYPEDQVRFYNPYRAAKSLPEEDDDLFMDAASGGSRGGVKTTTPEEAQQAIVQLVLDLLQ